MKSVYYSLLYHININTTDSISVVNGTSIRSLTKKLITFRKVAMTELYQEFIQLLRDFLPFLKHRVEDLDLSRNNNESTGAITESFQIMDQLEILYKEWAITRILKPDEELLFTTLLRDLTIIACYEDSSGRK